MKKTYRYTGFLFFLSMSAIGVGNLIFWALNEAFLYTFAYCFLAWTGYLMAHYSIEGEFIDGKDDDKDYEIRDKNLKEISGIIIGSIILLTSIAVLAISISNLNLYVSVFASIIFFTGYVITHYFVTEELL